MRPRPKDEMSGYQGRHLLNGRRALVTGGDSGIGRAVAVAFAKEGADVAIAYLCEDDDARHTASLVEREGRRCALFPGDLGKEENCERLIEDAVAALGGLDLLVTNIAYQCPAGDLTEISAEQWDRTFRTNIYSYFWTTKFAMKHLPAKSWLPSGVKPSPAEGA
jgi:NAD(P)-dependent dehydrogenase (short-subunit alcohol dehydrogenase family)